MSLHQNPSFHQLTQASRIAVARALDQDVSLAVTGLSGAGKSAFITSMVHQLLHANVDTLPFFKVVQKGRLFGAQRIPQTRLSVPRFDYDAGMSALSMSPPRWPAPTRNLSELRMELAYRPASGWRRHLTERNRLFLDIIDYPGEWLLDLPMLQQDFSSWSSEQQHLLSQTPRQEHARDWLEKAAALDLQAPADEAELASLAQEFARLLRLFKQRLGLYYLQPGRLLLPGELDGAPVLQFFPYPDSQKLQQALDAGVNKGSNLEMLLTRFNAYRKEVVERFYRKHFCRFDRQVVLVDCLQALNNGVAAFDDLRLALRRIMASFSYGSNNILQRLFSPNIDRLLIAATKADHVTPEQREPLLQLLRDLTLDCQKQARFHGVAVDFQALASVCASVSGKSLVNGEEVATLKGHLLDGHEPVVMFPGEVPAQLPSEEFFARQGFDFKAFAPPLRSNSAAVLPHLGLDKALQHLLGDKIQ